MKKCHEKSLETIMKHKEYFDQKLIEITTAAVSENSGLRCDLFHLREVNKQLADDLRCSKSECRSMVKEVNSLQILCEKKDVQIDELMKRLRELEEQIKKNEKEIEEKSRQMDEIIKKNDEIIEKMNRKIRKLESSNSTNSNMPTSFDVLSHTVAKANANTRKKTGLKRGGQKGHKLHRSTLSPNPDKIVRRYVDKAPAGAVAVTDENGDTYYAVQEVDFVLKSHITETRYYIAEDGEKLDEKEANKYAINPSVYSSRFKASAIYLNNKGTVPLQRMCDMIHEISGGSIRLKPSTLVKWNQEMHEASENVRKDILTDILQGGIVHVDETGCKIAAEKYWIHAITNGNGSCFILTKKRGDKEKGPVALLEGYEGVVVHDHFKPYHALDKCVHAECNAHIDRYMKPGIDIDKNKECEEMLELLHKMLRRKNELIEAGEERMDEQEIIEFETKYLEIAKRGLAEYYEKNSGCSKKYEPDYVATFRRMIKFKDDHLRFITDFSVPYTNNAAERQCRVVKTKKKISGQFVSEDSAAAYTDILTLLQTANLRNENALAYLARVLS